MGDHSGAPKECQGLLGNTQHLEKVRKDSPLQVFRGKPAWLSWYLDFGFPTFRNVRQHFSAILSHTVCGTLLSQCWGSKMLCLLFLCRNTRWWCPDGQLFQTLCSGMPWWQLDVSHSCFTYMIETGKCCKLELFFSESQLLNIYWKPLLMAITLVNSALVKGKTQIFWKLWNTGSELIPVLRT